MAVKRLTLLVGALCADSARIQRRHKQETIHGVKIIADIPVFNFDRAFEGKSSLAEMADHEEEWTVFVNMKTTDAQINALCKRSGHCKKVGHPSEQGVPFFHFSGTEKDLETVLASGAGVVKFAEPDLKARAIPEMPVTVAAAASWGLDRIGVSSRPTTGVGVHVYVLDTGIRASHVDFEGRVTTDLDMSIGTEGKRCGNDLSCAMDMDGHGTHCSGSVAGKTYGVAPGANLHAVKVLGDDGSGSWSWSYSALDYVATEGVRPSVVSMSLGGGGRISGMEFAVNAAVNAGVTVVVAGGNENKDACNFSPAFVPSAITVGSINKEDKRSVFSNYGACTDIWAPGTAITSAGRSSDTAEETFSGTSMACPHVAGAAALLLQSNPSWRSTDVLASMLSTAADRAISNLRAGDVNKLLWVSAEAAPPGTVAPVPTKCPSFSAGDTPDKDGDCSCRSNSVCHFDGRPRCPYSNPNTTSSKWFLISCVECKCVETGSRPTPAPAPTTGSTCQALGCGAAFDASRVCQCNDNCSQYGNCCSDYQETCGSDTASCAVIGCGIDYSGALPCQCNSRCNRYNNCCSDYSSECSR